MKTILVTAIGSFAASAVIDGCREYGYRVIGSDIYPREWLSEGGEVDVFYKVPRADTGKEYLDAICGIIEKENVSALIPLTDAEIDILNGNRGRLKPAELFLSPEESVSVFRDKVRCTEAVEKILQHADKSPEIRTIPSVPLGEADPLALDFPLIVKPLNGRSSEGLHRVADRTELKSVLSCIPEDGEGCSGRKDYIIQPMIRGNIITVDIVRDTFGSCVAIPREELLRTQNGAGLSVRVFRNRGLERTCMRLAEELNVTGCVNMEFIFEEGSGILWFLECNPHFSGGTAFSCKYGYNTVKNHLRALEGGKIDVKVPDSECWLVKKYMEVRTK
jgi:carbamoyl-phosphate synthase large subunit